MLAQPKTQFLDYEQLQKDVDALEKGIRSLLAWDVLQKEIAEWKQSEFMDEAYATGYVSALSTVEGALSEQLTANEHGRHLMVTKSQSTVQNIVPALSNQACVETNRSFLQTYCYQCVHYDDCPMPEVIGAAARTHKPLLLKKCDSFEYGESIRDF